MNRSILPLILIILDGWGIDKPNRGNAVTLADTPNLDSYTRQFPYTELFAHGHYAGLPKGQVGNSEAGHMNIGAGRISKQEAVKIIESIEDGTFFRNPAFLGAIRHVKKHKSNLHLMGMLSNGMSPHSDPKHIFALWRLAKEKGINKVYLHFFTDGRDSPTHAALGIIEKLERKMPGISRQIATIMGRFYAMDRKKEWSRTKMAYDALVLGRGRKAESVKAAITESYNRDDTDEFIEPYIICPQGEALPRIDHNDAVIFFNLRSDRARQLAKIFVQTKFTSLNSGAPRREKVLRNLFFVSMTDFGPDLNGMITAYPSVSLRNTLPFVLADLSQLYLAEAEKFAPVTYFFNGGYPGQVAGEDQMMVPSPDVRSYDVTPLMSSAQLTEIVLQNLRAQRYDFTVLNFAAPDMIGHTGNLAAGIKCCAGIDKFVGKIVQAYLKKNGTVMITADHGNIEEMIKLKTDEIDTEHSTNKVPFMLINKNLKKIKLRLGGGKLGDVAPTILDLLDIPKPTEMSGKTLITRKN
ncbi:2,3-bisphosphoglycerate-independent phosphoglycerate mutase [Candidatus Parcubacteria bacterium]|nr:MAG: 2,3-bisphosphoglycerate-independent phosphoglycerate mutase [Candidatus Parcubacteria bacterium]